MNDASQQSYPKRRSCARCIKAKVKCSVIQGGDRCERCHRLGRDCEFGNVDLRRRRKTLTRTERLEKRIEELAAQLAAQKDHGSQASNLGLVASPPAAAPGLSTPPISEDVETSVLENVQSSAEAFDEVYFPRNPQKAEGDVVDQGLLSPARAEELVEKFKTVKMPSFPFVIVPSSKTATSLRQENPFLFLAMMTASLEDDLVLQRRIAEEVRSAISTRIVLGNEKTLELLQGLLVYLAWYYYHFAPKSHQMYLMLNLARSLVFDLCLDRSPNSNAQELGLLMEIKMRLSLPHSADMCEDIANGKRAFLGYYYLSSVLCVCRKGLAMKHTPWVDECCRSLVERGQYPTDASIERFVRVRSLHQNICDTLHADGETVRPSDSIMEMSQVAFQNELSTLEAGLPTSSDLEHYVLQIECLTASVAIHEATLYTVQASSIASLSRTSSLSSLLSSSRALANFCLRVPDDTIQHLPISSIIMFWYGFLILAKVVLIPSSPGWDREIAKREADLSGLGRAAKEKLTSVKLTQSGEAVNTDVWTYFCHIMRSMLIWNKKQEQQDKDDPIAEGLWNADNAVAKMNNSSCPPDYPSCDGTFGCPTDDDHGDQTARIAEIQSTPEMSQDSWAPPPNELLDDSLWQRVLEDFTLLPPAPIGGFPAGAFAPYAYP